MEQYQTPESQVSHGLEGTHECIIEFPSFHDIIDCCPNNTFAPPLYPQRQPSPA